MTEAVMFARKTCVLYSSLQTSYTVPAKTFKYHSKYISLRYPPSLLLPPPGLSPLTVISSLFLQLRYELPLLDPLSDCPIMRYKYLLEPNIVPQALF